MWKLDQKEGWVPKNWCFQIVVLEKTLKTPLDSKEIKPVNPKGISPEYSLEGLTLKLQYFGHLMWRAKSLEKTLILEGRWRRGQQRMRWLDSITDSMSLSKLQEIVRIGKPGMLQSMGSQRAGRDLVTEQQQLPYQVGTTMSILQVKKSRLGKIK